MGVRIIEGEYDGTASGAVMLDSVTEWAFGPLFKDAEEAELFIEWHQRKYGTCVRRATQPQLADRFSQFRELVTECSVCGDLILDCATCEDCLDAAEAENAQES